MDYGDIYDQTFNMSFQQKMETIQDNAALAITDAIRGSSRENFTKNYAWRLFNSDVGIENFDVSTKY